MCMFDMMSYDCVRYAVCCVASCHKLPYVMFRVANVIHTVFDMIIYEYVCYVVCFAFAISYVVYVVRC